MTAADFERLAAEADPAIARVRCLPPQETGKPIRLLIVPNVEPDGELLMLDDFALTDDMVARVTEHLDERRILGTAIEIGTPFYQGVTIAALIKARVGRPCLFVRERAMAELYRYLNPLHGGPNGTGWPFDADLNSANVFQLLEAVEGVERVEEVLFFEHDLRNHVRIGFGKELVKLSRDSLFLAVQPPGGGAVMPRHATTGSSTSSRWGWSRTSSWSASCRSSRTSPTRSSTRSTTCPHMFDPTVAPPAMVRALGGWVGLDWVDPSTSERRQRRIVLAVLLAAALAGHEARHAPPARADHRGAAIVEESGGIYRGGRRRPSASATSCCVSSARAWATEPDLLRIVRAELPASVTFELFVGDRQIWPPDATGTAAHRRPGDGGRALMADIVCPECGLVTSLTAIRRAADEFCTHCDYPLFWAPTALPLVAGSAPSDATLRRLPGAGGRLTIGTLVCPQCGELNPMTETLCIRDGCLLHCTPSRSSSRSPSRNRRPRRRRPHHRLRSRARGGGCGSCSPPSSASSARSC